MNPRPRQGYRNRVLAALPKAEINRLKPHLSPVVLEQEQTLLDGQAPYAYFLEDGIASVVVTLKNGGRHHWDRRRGWASYFIGH